RPGRGRITGNRARAEVDESRRGRSLDFVTEQSAVLGPRDDLELQIASVGAQSAGETAAFAADAPRHIGWRADHDDAQSDFGCLHLGSIAAHAPPGCGVGLRAIAMLAGVTQ